MPYEIPLMSQFVIRESLDNDKRLLEQARIVMKALRVNLFNTYELHGYGKAGCEGVDRVSKLINAWIMVV